MIIYLYTRTQDWITTTEIVEVESSVLVMSDNDGFVMCKMISKHLITFTEEGNSLIFSVGDLQIERPTPTTEEGWQRFEYVIIDPTKPPQEQIVALADQYNRLIMFG